MKTQEAFPPRLIFKHHIRNSGDEILVMCYFERGRPTDISINVFGPIGESGPACWLPARVLNTLMTALGTIADVLDWYDKPNESWGGRPDACAPLIVKYRTWNGGGTILITCSFPRGRPTDIYIEVLGPNEDPEAACHVPARVLNTLMTLLGALADVLDWSDISDESWGFRHDECGWLQERCELGNGGDGDLDR
jgi:hypothetical protein